MRWEVKPLGEVCDVNSGSTPKRNQKEFWEEGDVPWFTVKDIRAQGREIRWTLESVTQKALDETSLNIVPEGSVLLCCTASVGEYALTRIPTTFNQQFNGLTPSESIAPRFLMFWCSTLQKELLSLSGKATVDFVSQSKLKNIMIPIPPMNEQERIVEVLDAAFEAIDKAKANIERNLANARELFQSRLNDIFSNPSSEWGVKPLGEVCDVNSGSTPKRNQKEFWEEGDVPWFTVKDIRAQGREIRWTLESVTQKALDETSLNIVPEGSVLLCCTASVGEYALTRIPTTFNQQFNGLTPSDSIAPRFLMFWCSTLQKELLSLSGKATVDFVSQSKLKNIMIPIPPMNVQECIVMELDVLIELKKAIELKYQIELEDLEELRQSILEQAFEGKLTESIVA